jgi:hypothetical protein
LHGKKVDLLASAGRSLWRKLDDGHARLLECCRRRLNDRLRGHGNGLKTC